jgi:hypothetical protein
MTVAPRRVGVFIDYWWVYSSARQAFPGPENPPPSWFGNVWPSLLARTLVKRPPMAARRSERSLAAVHVFVRHYDPEAHRSQHERVLRWQAEDAQVHVGPSRESGGGFWQSSVNVALAAAVAGALGRGAIDAAIVFAGDAALLPLFTEVAAEDASRIELATWVAPDGAVPSPLAATAGVWCHRLGEATFRLVTDDRRLQRNRVPPPGPPRGGGGGGGAAGGTAMAAAFGARLSFS